MDAKIKFNLVFMTVALLTACQGSGGNAVSPVANTALTLDHGATVTISEVPVNAGSANPLAGFTQTTFSKHIYKKDGTATYLIDFNFFPAQTDFDSVKKTAQIPCDYNTTSDDNVNVSLNAPTTETPCDAGLVVDLSQATFTFLGVEFTMDSSIDVFVDIFEFKITSSGFVDSFDQTTLNVAADNATVEGLYDAIIAKRISTVDED